MTGSTTLVQTVGGKFGSFLSGTTNPPVVAGAYASGQVLGGLQTFLGLPGGGEFSGYLTSLLVTSKVAITAPIDFLAFSSLPVTVWTENAAVNMDVADLPKVLDFVGTLTSWIDMGTPNVGSLACRIPLSSLAAALYLVPVIRGAVTFGSVSDLSITAKIDANS